MTEAARNTGMCTNRSSLEGRDIETGSNNEHVTDIAGKIMLIEGPLHTTSYGENVVEIDNWVGTLSRKLEDVPPYMCVPGHPGRISRIPEHLREVDVKAYEPFFLSIGPYHHGNPRVQQMEKRKQVVLKYFLEQKPELTLKQYLTEIENIEPEARMFYSDVDMDREKFVKMLLLDTIFVLSLFCGVPGTREREASEVTGSRDDEKTTMMMARDDEMSRDDDTPRLFTSSFWHDLFLLENQLPFSVLQKIHTLTYGDSETKLLDMMKVTIGCMLPGYAKLDSEMVVSQTGEIHHLLQICHMFFRPTLQQESTCFQSGETKQMFRLRSAVQLYESGVGFMARSGSTQHSLLDITFNSSGKMVMPCLHVDDNTNSLLRNLIALEQMKYPSLGLNISAYAVLLLHLITVPEDVLLLRRKRIIQHHLASDKEMMYLVNRLSVGLTFDYVEDDYSLKYVFHELKKYSERRVPRWRAWLTHRYFNNPWTVISLLAASLLLFLSCLQTFYSVYAYYHPFFDGHQ